MEISDHWSKLCPYQKYRLNPFLYRNDVDIFMSKKFDGRYTLITNGLSPIYFKKKYGNRNIEYYNLKCNLHNNTFSIAAQNIKCSVKFLKKCKGCAQAHNKRIAVLSFDDLNDKLRNSNSELIKKYHYILDLPGKNKSKPKSLRLKCTRHNSYFSQDQGLLGKHHGCKKCASLASQRKYNDTELKKLVVQTLEDIETGLSEIYTYQSSVRDRHKHYKITFLCYGNGHIHPYPISYYKNIIHKRMCPKCYPKGSISRGERVIADILKKEQITFEKTKTFEDLKHKQKLLLDFYIESLNLCIEFDGEQHFKKQGYEKDNHRLKTRLKRDLIKNSYCLHNKINLLRIPFYKLKTEENITDIVTNAIHQIKQGKTIQISNDPDTLAFYQQCYANIKDNSSSML